MSVSTLLDSSSADQAWKSLKVYSMDCNSNASVGGNLDISGSCNFNGPVNFNSNGPLLPSSDNIDDLGSSIQKWKTLYLGTDAKVDGQLVLSNNTNQIVLTHNDTKSITINCPAPADSKTYEIPDIGDDGQFVVADSSNDVTLNDLTVNQLNYTSLNPPIAPATFGQYLFSSVTPQALPGVAGGETYIVCDTVEYSSGGPDITNEGGGVYRVNNSGVYLCSMKITDVSATNTNVACAIANGALPDRFGYTIGGSSTSMNGSVSTQCIVRINATEAFVFLGIATATSAGNNVSGAGFQKSYISIARIA